jgi:murein L,D-transpeptidase YafK
MLSLLYSLAAAAEVDLHKQVSALGLSWPPPQVWVSVDKSDHQLQLWSGEVLLKTYPVALGEPAGDKERQGDRRTPNGELRVVTRNARSQFHLFLGLSYPNAEDAQRGLESGLINKAQATEIRAADRAGRQPPWGTPLGGAVGIHGGGTGSDWTLGCVALSNEHIEELWGVMPIGTRVVVRE